MVVDHALAIFLDELTALRRQQIQNCFGGAAEAHALRRHDERTVHQDRVRADGVEQRVVGAHPILMNRPLVVTPNGVRLCRPSEAVLDLLPPQRGQFIKEDGERVIDDHGRRVATA